VNPDVASAIRRLVREKVLTRRQAYPLWRVARGELISLYWELRLVLYAGVLLVTAGVGALVVENLDRLGPFAVTAALTVAVGVCFFWILRKAPPFSWSEAPSEDLAFDYILLLGVLLASADVAYIEAQFTPLGPHWPWHLLWASVFMGWASIRYDSRVVFSLAMASFASWRGVSLSFIERDFWSNFETSMRLNTVVCGLLFVGMGFVLRRAGRKAHFEPVATYLGWTLVLMSLLSGVLSVADSFWAYTVLSLLVGSVLALRCFLHERFPLFAMGVTSAYIGLSRAVIAAVESDVAAFSWLLVTSVLLIGLLFWAHRVFVRTP
jgi:hypothetical protein